MNEVAARKKRYLARSKDIAARGLGDETMIMSARDSSLFTLNETASAIWNAADGVTPLDEIVAQRVVADFDVDMQQALRDAEALVDELVQHGILRVSDAPITDAAS